MNRQGPNSRDGFSLVETIIVLAIVGIIATIGVGNVLAARPHALLEGTDIQLASMLAQARNMAISQELNTRVVFNASLGEFWIERQDRATLAWVAVGVHSTLPDGVQFAPSGITFPSGHVLFTTRGTLITGGSITYTAIQTGESSTLTGNLVSGRFVPAGGNLR